jgi:hypothetical protein
MNSSAFHYSVRLPLAARAVSREWLGSKFLTTLDALAQIDSTIFPGWEVHDLLAMKEIPLATARSRIAEIIGSYAEIIGRYGDDDLDRPEPESDYAVAANTTNDARSRRMTLSVDTWMDEVELKAGDELVAPDPAIVTYPLFRAALLAINAIWQQTWACARAFRVDYKEAPLYPGAALFPYSRFHIPWIVYLGPSLLNGGVSLPDIKTENMPDGGVLMTATEERLDPTNPEHLSRARVLAETLIARVGAWGLRR